MPSFVLKSHRSSLRGQLDPVAVAHDESRSKSFTVQKAPLSSVAPRTITSYLRAHMDGMLVDVLWLNHAIHPHVVARLGGAIHLANIASSPRS